jgi:hypothetical protein
VEEHDSKWMANQCDPGSVCGSVFTRCARLCYRIFWKQIGGKDTEK